MFAVSKFICFSRLVLHFSAKMLTWRDLIEAPLLITAFIASADNFRWIITRGGCAVFTGRLVGWRFTSFKVGWAEQKPITNKPSAYNLVFNMGPSGCRTCNI